MSEVVTRLDRVSRNAKTREEKEREELFYRTDVPDGKSDYPGSVLVLFSKQSTCFQAK